MTKNVRAHLSAGSEGLRSAIRDWLVVLLGLLVARGGAALALVVVARRVSPIEYGQYLSSQALAAFVVVLPDWGLDMWLLTRGGSSPRDLSGLWRGSLRLRLRLLAAWVVAMTAMGIALPADTFPLEIFLPTALGVGAEGIVLLAYAALRCADRHRRVSVVQSLSSIILLGITLLLPLGSGGIVLFAVGKSLLSVALAAALILMIRLDYLPWPGPPVAARVILPSARPFLIADVATAIYEKTDLTIVSLFLGASAASVYGPALSVLQMSFLAFRALFALAVPGLSRTYVHARQAFVQRSVLQLVAQAALGAIVSVALFLFAPSVVELVFGSAYRRSGEVLRLLSLVPLLRSLSFALGAILASGNRQPQRTKVQMVCALFRFLGSLGIVVPFGLAGVATVYILSELLLAGGYVLVTVTWSRERSGGDVPRVSGSV